MAKGGNIKTNVRVAAGKSAIASKAPAKMSGKMSTGAGPYSGARTASSSRAGKSRSGHEGE